jgi:hypothetical protein
MWWSYWPTIWFPVVPLMMLACMAGMFVMMRSMHARYCAGSAGTGIDVACTGPHLAAHFPEGTTPFKEYPAETVRRLDQEQKDFWDVAEPLGSVKDNVEFDEFLARLNAGTTSPPSLAAEGGADGR